MTLRQCLHWSLESFPVIFGRTVYKMSLYDWPRTKQSRRHSAGSKIKKVLCLFVCLFAKNCRKRKEKSFKCKKKDWLASDLFVSLFVKCFLLSGDCLVRRTYKTCTDSRRGSRVWIVDRFFDLKWMIPGNNPWQRRRHSPVREPSI